MPKIPGLPDGGALAIDDEMMVDRAGTSRRAKFTGVSGASINVWEDAGGGQVAHSVSEVSDLEPVMATRFGAVSQARGIASPTNYTTQLQNALDYAAGHNRPLFLPPGAWFHTGLLLRNGQMIWGSGRTASGFRIIANTAQHSLRPENLTAKHVVLRDFYIDGNRGNYTTLPVDLSTHSWGDGIYMNLDPTPANFTGGFDANALWAGPRWTIERLLIHQPMRHGIYTAGQGRHRMFDIMAQDTYVDGFNVNHNSGDLTRLAVYAAGRNGISLSGPQVNCTDCRAEFCGVNTARANGQPAAIANAWLLAAGGVGEIGPGGACGLIIRGNSNSSQFQGLMIRDTFGPAIILNACVDCNLGSSRANNVGSLRLQHSMGANTAVPTQVVQILGAAIGNVITVNQTDLYATLAYSTNNLLAVTGTLSVDNQITIRWDNVQTYATPRLFTGDTEATWTARGNTSVLTSVQRR